MTVQARLSAHAAASTGSGEMPLRLLHHLARVDIDEPHAQRARVPGGDGDVIEIARNPGRDPAGFVRARLRRLQRERLLDARRGARGGTQAFANARDGIVRKPSLHQHADGPQRSRRRERRERRQRELTILRGVG
jgi:hypothetical protein